MLGDVTNQAVDGLDRTRKIFVVRDASAAFGAAGGVAIVLVDVDQVDVAGDIELARTELAHADDA